ncbi:hypothetical protein [Pseudoneobacillus sp. C159]
MNKLNYWGLAALIGLLLVTVYWWIKAENRNDPLSGVDAFIYSEDGGLYWLELANHHGKVEGKLYQQEVIEEIGKEPYLEEKSYSLAGKTTEIGYEFKSEHDGKPMKLEAWFSGDYLIVQKQDEKYSKLYMAVNEKELALFKKGLQQKLDMAIYHSEEKEKSRRREFFSKLRSVYGYIYTAEDESFQLFVKMDEALPQGELAGSLLMVAATGDKDNRYKETRYDFSGITDGMMMELFTSVDEEETKLEGNFHKDATGFDLSFWTTNDKLSFQAVTEEEFRENYEDFKSNIQK